MKTGGWDKKALRGSELGGKTLGIIGMGRIGHTVADLANAFGMTVVGYDPLIDEKTIQERGAEPVPLVDIYSRSDMITLHIPLSPDTRGMVNGEAFARMKRGVYIICAARGGIIDETALLARLESGQVAGAALDVFAEEPPGLTALISHPNVIATPHISAQTKEAQERTAIHIAEEIMNSLEGKPLRWKVV
jgi:D-3-phosphoglycerate dehydrogenase